MLEFHASIFSRKTPINGRLCLITLHLPGSHTFLHRIQTGETSTQGLPSQHRELYLGHIQPTSMNRSRVDLQTLSESPCLFWLEHLIKRSGRVRIQVIHHCKSQNSPS